MRSIVLSSAALLMLTVVTAGNAYIGCTVSPEELAKIPTARDPWAILQATPGALIDRINIGYDESGQQAAWSVDGAIITNVESLGSLPPVYFDDLEELRTTLLAAEEKTLCEEVQRENWECLTLENTLRVASSQEEALVKADANGLLRGFVALLLDGKGCAEPPPEVLYEAREYSRRFGLP